MGPENKGLLKKRGGGKVFTHADVNVVDQNAESREDLCKKIKGGINWLIT